MNNLQSLDLLQVLSLYIQLKNIQWDQNQSDYIHTVIENINTEIEKLHTENDIIIQQNAEILTKLDKLDKI